MRKSERKRWSEVRKKILERDKDCIICKIINKNKIHKPRGLSTHHLIPETFEEFRFDEKNLITLCTFHHKGKYSAHQNPFWFVNFIKKYYSGLYDCIMTNLQKENIK